MEFKYTEFFQIPQCKLNNSFNNLSTCSYTDMCRYVKTDIIILITTFLTKIFMYKLSLSIPLQITLKQI